MWERGGKTSFLSENILDTLAQRRSGDGILRGQAEMSGAQEKNLRVVNVGQEGIMGGERSEKRRGPMWTLGSHIRGRGEDERLRQVARGLDL